MTPLIITVQNLSAFSLVADVLGKALQANTSVAICGLVGTGKTTLLRRLVDDLKQLKTRIVQFDFDAVLEDCQGLPEYIVIDHPTSPDSLVRVKEKYPNVPLLAVQYEKPEEGFDIIVEMLTPIWAAAS